MRTIVNISISMVLTAAGWQVSLLINLPMSRLAKVGLRQSYALIPGLITTRFKLLEHLTSESSCHVMAEKRDKF
jgi:hypothetical protein